MSPYFRKARRYVEGQGSRWFVLPANYGLIPLTDVISPYEETLTKISSGARRLWGDRELEELGRAVNPSAPFILLAG